jgi:aminobenzoyl-glutamate utilization protein B
VAAIGSPIGHKGMLTAAKVFALTTAELLRSPKEIQDARAEFAKTMKGRQYTTIIPEGQKAPKSIR